MLGEQAWHPAPAPTQEGKSMPASPGSQVIQDSEGESEALPPLVLAGEDSEGSVWAPDIFGDLADKQWSFFGAKWARG